MMLALKIDTYSDWVRNLEGATCVATWEGRTVTLKNLYTIDLIELSTQITSFFVIRGCPANERESLKILNKKLNNWIAATDKSLDDDLVSQFVDTLTYPKDGPIAFWKPGTVSEPVENLYTDKEWEEQFPGAVMPVPIKSVTKFKLFTDAQIAQAKEDSFVAI